MRTWRLDLLRHRYEPGLTQILGIVHSADVSEIENVTVTESVDVSCHHSVDTWKAVGYGRAVDDPTIPPDSLYKYTAVFADSVQLMADAFDLELDEVTFGYELGACTKDVDLGWYFLPKGPWAPATSGTRDWSTVCREWKPTSNGR